MARQVESAVRYTLRHALDREPDRVSIRIGRLVHQHGIAARRPSRSRRTRARRTSQTAGRTSPDAASILRRRRLPGGVPQRGRQPRGHVDEINALNVFPVPDGDTGTNMLATVKAALEEADKAGPDADADRIAQAASASGR